MMEGARQTPYTERAVGVVHAMADDGAVVNKYTANRDFVRAEGSLGHLKSSAHELFVVIKIVRRGHRDEGGGEREGERRFVGRRLHF